MDPGDLARRYPRLFHMAHRAAWPSIVAHGLLSTSALLRLFEVPGDQVRMLECRRRPESVPITHPVHGSAVIRDNKPISETKLAQCLRGMDPTEYYQLLNARVFFWLTEERLARLLRARAYRNDRHLVITVDTGALLERSGNAVTLSAINSGSTAYRAMPRGADTFAPIETYPYEERRRARGRAGAIAELAVQGGVPDILAVATSADVRDSQGVRERIWTRAATPPCEGGRA